MKGKVSIVLVATAAAVATLVAILGPPAQAQPVASIALPAPGAPKSLYPDCNNISLTFPDGTASQQVVQAVTPAGTVKSMWRHNGALGKFEGFSPAYPQASDLLSVNFLDAVWLCMEGMPGATAPPPPPPPGPTAIPPPPPPPPPAGPTADLAVTDLFPDNLPAGNVIARITNHGPDSLNNVNAELDCRVSPQGYGTVIFFDQQHRGPITLNLNPGQTAEFPTGLSIDISQAMSEVRCETIVPFSDTNPGNNEFTETFPTADVAVTNIFPAVPPGGNPIMMDVTNNGPGTLANVPVELACSERQRPLPPPATPWGPLSQHPPWTVALNLNPGDTAAIATPVSLLFGLQSEITCEVRVKFADPISGNDSLTRVFPP